jgi:excisionase family DNA binding protein
VKSVLEDTILDIGDAADYLRIKKWTLYRLAKKGKVPGVKIGGQWRFKKEVLDRLFLDSSASVEDEKPN